MVLEVSDTTFKRLQRHAVPLVDSVEDVLVRLLDHFENSYQQKEVIMNNSTSRAVLSDQFEPLRGLQRELWELVIMKMPNQRFSLRDVYDRMAPLVKLRPQVQEIEASIRAALEKLRDKGFIEFIDNRGQYRRLR